MSLLQVKSLQVSLQGFHLQEIDFCLHQGEILGLVGESGSGKTLLSHLILRLIKDYEIQKGEILFLGQDLLKLKESQMQSLRGKDISYIFQEPLSALNPLQKIKKQLNEAILIHNPKIKKQALQEKVFELLTNVNLTTKILESYPYELSGGQRQRVCIAIALANSPKILIADEPTTALDSTTQAQIIALLKHLQQKFHLSILFISHNLAVVAKLCPKLLVLQNGKIVENGTTEEIFKNPKNPYTKMLIQSLGFHYNQESYTQKPLLEVRNLSVAYPTKKSFWGETLESFIALSPLSFSLRERESLGIIGESGSGKSSLAHALCRLLAPKSTQGEMKLLGKDFFALKGAKLRRFRKEIQIIFQDPFSSLNPKMNIFKILQEGILAHQDSLHFTPKDLENQIIQSLIDVGLDKSYLERYPNELSGGQRQRISIARSLILRPKVLILDEPTSALDRATQNQILALLLTLGKQYHLSYLCISHDLSVIASLCQNVLVLREGKMLEYGATKEVFNNPKHPYVKDLLKASEL
ncbi:dipeptide ABC transporter ATP-binding protein [Helicobacter sp.]|uniref:dipeptide ABC transporter ATP-binding protein n=1 Tax=Helicobacter sp. TaxID=218 RepID=UPI0019BA0BC5|nr:dipeptide ABC transporter ATP-binding protein [Helicobacter sp.]MBD5164487.1 ABC transporter ATP-binding protein [Helicobacter sp.]